MSSPEEGFNRRAFEVFKTDELNEPLLMIYQHLQLALREKCDELILSREELVHITKDGTVKRLPMVYGNTSLYSVFKDSLLEIFERDPLVKEYFQLEQMGDDNLVIKRIESS